MSQPSNRLLKGITHKVIELISNEIKKEETQQVLKEQIISPLVRFIFKEINQYVYGLVALIFLTMLFSLLTFVLFLLSRCKTST